jgi:hypothetical protein
MFQEKLRMISPKIKKSHKYPVGCVIFVAKISWHQKTLEKALQPCDFYHMLSQTTLTFEIFNTLVTN